MVGIAAALVAVILGTLYGSLSGYLGGKVDSVMMRLLEILNSLPVYVLRHSAGDLLRPEHSVDFVAIGMVSGWIWRVSYAARR